MKITICKPGARAVRRRQRAAATDSQGADSPPVGRVGAHRRHLRAFETGTPERAQHGGYYDDVEHELIKRPNGLRYSTERGPVKARRRRYGCDIDRLRIDDDLKQAARRLVDLAARAEWLGNIRSPLSRMIDSKPRPVRDDREAPDPDDMRIRAAMAARKLDQVLGALSIRRRVIGGARLSERDVVIRVILGGVPVAK